MPVLSVSVCDPTVAADRWAEIDQSTGLVPVYEAKEHIVVIDRIKSRINSPTQDITARVVVPYMLPSVVHR